MEAQQFVSCAGSSFDVLRAKRLQDICHDQDRVDLLHVDIQGGEAALIRAALPFLESNVAYIVVGTHGRQLEGDVISTLDQAGWILEIEEPCTLPLPLRFQRAYASGVQGWRNPKLVPEGRDR